MHRERRSPSKRPRRTAQLRAGRSPGRPQRCRALRRERRPSTRPSGGPPTHRSCARPRRRPPSMGRRRSALRSLAPGRRVRCDERRLGTVHSAAAPGARRRRPGPGRAAGPSTGPLPRTTRRDAARASPSWGPRTASPAVAPQRDEHGHHRQHRRLGHRAQQIAGQSAELGAGQRTGGDDDDSAGDERRPKPPACGEHGGGDGGDRHSTAVAVPPRPATLAPSL